MKKLPLVCFVLACFSGVSYAGVTSPCTTDAPHDYCVAFVADTTAPPTQKVVLNEKTSLIVDSVQHTETTPDSFSYGGEAVDGSFSATDVKQHHIHAFTNNLQLASGQPCGVNNVSEQQLAQPTHHLFLLKFNQPAKGGVTCTQVS
jgi:hypothetical protein